MSFAKFGIKTVLKSPCVALKTIFKPRTEKLLKYTRAIVRSTCTYLLTHSLHGAGYYLEI
jgi:hypothetical protein